MYTESTFKYSERLLWVVRELRPCPALNRPAFTLEDPSTALNTAMHAQEERNLIASWPVLWPLYQTKAFAMAML